MGRLRILLFVRHYLPGYKSGGPVRTISNLVHALGDEFDFRIVTSDRDFLDGSPFPGVLPDRWSIVGKGMVYYESPRRQGVLSCARMMREQPHDVLCLNSLFDPVSSLNPMLARRIPGTPAPPVVLAPRGELSPEALALKGWKKRVFLSIARSVEYYRGVLWHASNEEEAHRIRQQFGESAQIVVASDLADLSALATAPDDDERREGPLRIVFLSRISRMKNLDYALKSLARCPVPVQFDIWGTTEDKGYWKECRKLIEGLPANVVAVYRGVANHSRIAEILSGYDLFFLPTRGENYGHAIAESLLVGTPVLISDRTPWRGLDTHGVGWDLPLDDDGSDFLRRIEVAAKKVTGERAFWRRRVREYAAERLGDSDLIEANRQVLLRAMGCR